MVLFRSETLCFLIPKRWALLSPEMKNIISSEEFKSKKYENGHQTVFHVGYPNMYTKQWFYLNILGKFIIHFSFFFNLELYIMYIYILYI